MENQSTTGPAGAVLTILLVCLVAEGSEVLVQGLQRDARGIMPALPGKEQLPVAPRGGQDGGEL